MNMSVKQLKSLFEDTITTLSIAEPISIQTPETYEEYSIISNYDTVVFKIKEDDALLCWDRFNNEKPRPIKHSEIVTDSTPLLAVVQLLVKKKRLFVHERNSIKYIVTLSDLEKMPVRNWLFGLISLTEMELKNLIDRNCINDSFLDLLSVGRRAESKKLYDKKVKSNSEIKYVTCLQYCDIETILKKSTQIQESFRRKYSKSDCNILSEAQKLRDMLAHAQKLDMP